MSGLSAILTSASGVSSTKLAICFRLLTAPWPSLLKGFPLSECLTLGLAAGRWPEPKGRGSAAIPSPTGCFGGGLHDEADSKCSYQNILMLLNGPPDVGIHDVNAATGLTCILYNAFAFVHWNPWPFQCLLLGFSAKTSIQRNNAKPHH